MSTRRRFLASGSAAAVLPAQLQSAPEADHAIARENALPGASDWLLTQTRVDPATRYRCPDIEGYCSHTSIRAGEEITFFVSVDPPSKFTLEIFRLGYYGGIGARLLQRLGPFPGAAQPAPPAEAKRLRRCAWKPGVSLTIPRDWLSGVYLGKLTKLEGGWQSYTVFIVRDDRKADVVFQCSDTTWQAYNRWPDQFSLYDDGIEQWYWGGDVQVSFQRPYGKYCQIFDQPLSQGSGEFLLWEFPLAYWLEERGYDVTYISNLDTHRDPAQLRRAKAFLSVGHDEYWTLEMFEHVREAIAQGLTVLFLSGNTCCGRILYEEATRAFERIDVFGPPDPEMRFAGMGELPHRSPHANTLIGAHSTPPVTGGADWTCVLPGHWIFEGTGMKKGDSIPGLVGWEWHGDPAKALAGLEIVATGPTQSAPGEPNGGIYTATVYPGPRGNFVFNASTIWWADGLSAPPGYLRPKVYTEPRGPDPRVQRITENLLRRAGALPVKSSR
ncbi:MAG TPA: N,N-dimethylformamidase beta subunit family domain-containing protein [Verrucomicrobiales bacterium]|nr:N,N-dimethylformamidase beta subunit family domain-containing protein [Verrucomicrobiales bacterium]